MTSRKSHALLALEKFFGVDGAHRLLEAKHRAGYEDRGLRKALPHWKYRLVLLHHGVLKTLLSMSGVNPVALAEWEATRLATILQHSVDSVKLKKIRDYLDAMEKLDTEIRNLRAPRK